PVDVAVSPDGRHVYVAAETSGAIALFLRDNISSSQTFGNLAFQTSITDSDLAGVQALVVTADGRHLYAAGTSGLVAYERDPTSGALTSLQTFSGTIAASPRASLAATADGKFVAHGSNAGVTVYERDNDSGSLTFGELTETDTDATSARGVSFVTSEVGLSLYAGSSGGIEHWVVDTDTGMLGTVDSTVLAGFDTNNVFAAPDGEHVFAVGGGSDELKVFRRTPTTGSLALQETVADAPNDDAAPRLAAPSSVVVTGDGRHVLVSAAEESQAITPTSKGAITVFDREAPEPVFGLIEVEKAGVNDSGDSGGSVTGLSGASSVVVSGDGDHVYATGFSDSTISTFTRDPDLGLDIATQGQHLNFLESVQDSAMLEPVDIKIAPIGDDFVYVAAQASDSVHVFARESDGTLTALPSFTEVDDDASSPGSADGLFGVTALALDPSGEFLYTAGRFDAGIGIFDVNRSTGELTYLGIALNGENGVASLRGVRDVAVTADGKYVIAAASEDNAIVVFERIENPTASEFVGGLRFLQAFAVSDSRPLGLALSDDHIYVAGATADAILVLARDSETGRLRLIQTFENFDSGSTVLNGPRAVALSNDESKLFVVAEDGDGALVFGRNTDPVSASYGEIEFLEETINGRNGVTGLDRPYDVAVAPNGGNAYVVGLDSSALAAFRLGAGSSCSASGSGSIDDEVNIAAGGAVSYSAVLELRSDALGGATICRKEAGDEASAKPNNLCNFAEIRAEGVTDMNGGQSATHDTAVLTPEADLQISKNNDQVSTVPGERVTYTIEIVNNGPSDAVHNLPGSVTFTDSLSSQFDLSDTTWTCDALGSGGLSFVEAQDVVSRDATEDPAVEISLLAGVSAVLTIEDPDSTGPLGDLVLAANPELSTVSVFGRNTLTGEITPQLVLQDSVSFNPDALVGGADIIQSVSNLAGARALAATADGQFVFVAAQASDQVHAFELGQAAGLPTLTLADSISGTGLNQPVALAYDAANDRLYVAASNSDAVSAHSFDPGTGAFTQLDLEVDGIADPDDSVGAVSGLNGAVSLALTPSADFLFVAARESQRITRFAVNGDGTLVFDGSFDATSLGTSLSGVSRLHLSADGMTLFASATAAGSVGVFSVDAMGGLALLQEIDSTTVDSNRFAAPGAVIETADGRHLYIAARDGDAIFALRFDANAEVYVPVSVVSGAMDSSLGLDEPRALAFSPDDEFLYIAGASAPAVAVFQRQDDSDCQASGTGAPENIALRIAAGGQVVFEIDTLVNADATGSLSNTATIDADVDSTPGDSSATDEDVLNRRADLAITKTDDRAEFDGLAAAADVLVADDLHVYVAGRSDAAIGRFLRDDDPQSSSYGLLEFVGAVRQGENGATGLLGVSDLDLSNDGLLLIAAGTDSNALSIFDRDPTAGTLTPRFALVSGSTGISGLNGASATDFSFDDRHFYATAQTSNALSVFAIDPDTDAITQVQVIQDGVMSVTGLAAPTDVLVSPDDKHVYVAAPDSNSILAFVRNPSEGSSSFGQLTFVDQYEDQSVGIDGLEGVRSLAISPDGSFLYALGSREASLAVFSRDATTGELMFVERKADGTGGVTGLSGARSLSMKPDGSRLYVAATASDAVVWFDVAMDGTLAFADSISSMSGTNDGLAGAAAVALSEPHLYVAASEDNSVTTLLTNGSTSVLGSIVDGRGGVAPGSELTYRIEVFNHGPSDVIGATVKDVFPSEFESIQWVCTPDGVGAGCRVCTASNLDECSGDINESVDLPSGTSVLFEATGLIRPGVTGTLVNTATVTAPAGVTDGTQSNNSATDDDTVMAPAADVMVEVTALSGNPSAGAPADYQIDVVNLGPSVARDTRVQISLPELIGRATWTCSATPTPGLLGLIEEFQTELSVVRGFAVSPDGSNVYAVGDDASAVGSIAILERDSSSGRLGATSLVRDGIDGQGLGGAAGVVVSADGEFVFVAGAGDDAVAAFSRDASDGSLTFINQLTDGIGAEGLGGVSALALSPDGFYLYAASPVENSLTVLSVASNGTLGFVEQIIQGESVNGSNVDGLSGAADLVVSPDGAYLYAIGENNDAIATFARSPSTGELTYQSSILDFQVSGGGLLGPVDIAIAPDGSRVFVASPGSDMVSAFDRNDETGALSFALRVDSSFGGGVFTAPRAISVTSDGRLLQVGHAEGITSYQIRDDELRAIQTVAEPSAAPPDRGMAGGGLSRYLYAAAGDAVATLELGDGSFCTEEGSGPVDDLIDLSATGSVTYMVQGFTLPGARGDLVIDATAEVSSEAADPDPLNNADSVNQPVAVSSPVGVVKSDAATSVVAGETTQYTIDLANSGLSDALNVQITDVLPTLPGMTAGVVDATVAWTCTDQRPYGAEIAVSLPDIEALGGISAAAFSPAEDQLAVVSSAGALALLNRESDGDLTHVDLLTTGSEGADEEPLTALAGAAGVAFDPSGRFIFVAAADSNAVLAFEIDADTGLLEHVDTVVSSSQTPGLVGARSVAISPDGSHVYVGAETGNSIAILEWRSASRTLNHLKRVRDGFGDLSEVGVIDGPRRVAVQPDGQFVHVLSDGTGAFATFRRDADSGLLSLVEVLRSGSAGGALA
ncbi:MAG: beta-propeller fold lactonase family protein, partial [Xanthomonadales bacterium]|nr:beta-propeller fold lactonase family protein [Xanthomonadales bacterium]